MERSPTLAISSIFAGAMLFLLGRITSLEEAHLYMLWALMLGSFVAGAIIWGYRCGLDGRSKKLVRVLQVFFVTMSFLMVISVGFFLLILNSLYLSAYSLLGSIILWEAVSEIARRIP